MICIGSSVYVFKVSFDLRNFKLGNISFRVVSEIIDTAAPVSSSMICDLLSTFTGIWIGFEAGSFNLNK